MKKQIIYLLACTLFILIGFLVFNYLNRTRTKESESIIGESTHSNSLETQEVDSFLLADFPTEISLYNLEKVESSKFFVNDDASSSYLYGGPVNYYNIVFKTSANKTELFNYYKSKFDSINIEESSDSKLIGTVGEYTISISQYSETSETAYLQVFLPASQYQKENKFFSEYPNLILLNESWIEKESSYGLLNQKNGEIEYTQYFTLDTTKLGSDITETPFDHFFNQYSELYSGKDNFEKDSDNKMLSWTDQDYTITMTFSQDHGRIYLMLRKPINS